VNGAGGAPRQAQELPRGQESAGRIGIPAGRNESHSFRAGLALLPAGMNLIPAGSMFDTYHNSCALKEDGF